MMEIAPGVSLRLRGAEETWQCILNDAYAPIVCSACCSDLCCIQDAAFVLCPLCRVVTPMTSNEEAANHAGAAADTKTHKEQGDVRTDMGGGVGLGFTVEDLCQWQMEVLSGATPSY